ncbi:MAG: carboxypeptidase-like regulatory domain-containing protein [Patescibacteria group bacterium]
MKHINVIIVAVLLVGTVGCGGKISPTEPTPTPMPSPTPSPAPAPTPTPEPPKPEPEPAPEPEPTPVPTHFALRGRVTDKANGASIAGATLTITDGGEENKGRTATTDALGNYSFLNIAVAGMTLEAKANGYVTSFKGVTVIADSTLSFELEKVPVVVQPPTPSGPPTPSQMEGTWAVAVPVDSQANVGLNAFTVSAQHVMKLEFVACGEKRTADLPPVSGNEISSSGTFSFGIANRSGGGMMSIDGKFVSATRAEGTVYIDHCGDKYLFETRSWVAGK